MLEKTAQFGSWRIVGRDSVGKRATAQCATCGAASEISIEALERGPVACPGCSSRSTSGQTQRRASLNPATRTRRATRAAA
jgi:DNA-directed RNA polymerase subunit RPC12/RpoP